MFPAFTGAKSVSLWRDDDSGLLLCLAVFLDQWRCWTVSKLSLVYSDAYLIHLTLSAMIQYELS